MSIFNESVLFLRPGIFLPMCFIIIKIYKGPRFYMSSPGASGNHMRRLCRKQTRRYAKLFTSAIREALESFFDCNDGSFLSTHDQRQLPQYLSCRRARFVFFFCFLSTITDVIHARRPNLPSRKLFRTALILFFF